MGSFYIKGDIIAGITVPDSGWKLQDFCRRPLGARFVLHLPSRHFLFRRDTLESPRFIHHFRSIPFCLVLTLQCTLWSVHSVHFQTAMPPLVPRNLRSAASSVPPPAFAEWRCSHCILHRTHSQLQSECHVLCHHNASCSKPQPESWPRPWSWSRSEQIATTYFGAKTEAE